MKVRVDVTNGYTVSRPVGALDACTAPHLRDAMALLTSVPRIVIDLSEVSFIDSAGLAAFVNGIRRVREAGGQVVVCSARRQVSRALELIGFEQVVPVVATIDHAERIVTATATATVSAPV